MEKTYTVSGMTCTGCQAAVEHHLSTVDGVESAMVDLGAKTVSLQMNKPIPVALLLDSLPSKYELKEKSGERNVFNRVNNTNDTSLNEEESKSALTSTDSAQSAKAETQPSKLRQLKPLLIILGYISVATVLLNYSRDSWDGAMLDFMGLFFIVFSFFKILDLKGFPDSFRMYDPLAKAVPAYAWAYPFIETALGLMFLMRYQVRLALIVTIVILGITTVGVLKTLLDKKSIQCACLGTALKLPMTEATLIENAIMLVMAGVMML